MHQQPANGVSPSNPNSLALARGITDDANLFGLFAFIRKFRGILENQNGAINGCDSRCRGLEMALQNFTFAHIGIRKKAVGGFGVGPVLTGEWNWTAHCPRHLRHQLAQTTPKTHIAKLRRSKFVIDPSLRFRAPVHHRAPRQSDPVREHES